MKHGRVLVEISGAVKEPEQTANAPKRRRLPRGCCRQELGRTLLESGWKVFSWAMLEFRSSTLLLFRWLLTENMPPSAAWLFTLPGGLRTEVKKQTKNHPQSPPPKKPQNRAKFVKALWHSRCKSETHLVAQGRHREGSAAEAEGTEPSETAETHVGVYGEASEEPREMRWLPSAMKGMDAGLLKTRLFFCNTTAYSDLNFSEFFEAMSRFFSLELIVLAVISRKQYLS